LLIEKGHDVVPINPSVGEILGRRSYGALREVPRGIDMVDVFRRSEHVAGVVDETIAAGARILWLQLGVIDAAAAARAVHAGLTVVMDRCPAIEYRRLF
jgi:predicted CoA-binding protein